MNGKTIISNRGKHHEILELDVKEDVSKSDLEQALMDQLPDKRKLERGSQ